MPRNDNYPDDIRSYDDDPRSPFYVDPDAWITDAADKLAAAWLAELEKTKYIEELDWTLVDVHVARKEENAKHGIDQDVDDFIYEQAYSYVEQYREEFEPDPGDYADWAYEQEKDRRLGL